MKYDSFYTRLQILCGAVYYPIAGDGIYVLIGGSLFIFLCDMVSHIASIGFILLAFSSGYLVAYFYEITRATAIGVETLPQWPSLTSWRESILEPLFMFYGALIVSFSTSLIYGIMYSTKFNDPLFLASLFISTFLLPTILMSVIFDDSFRGLLPWRFLKLMLLDVRLYLIVVVIFQIVILLQIVFDHFVAFKTFWIASHVVTILTDLYGLFVLARCCGLFLRMNQDSLLRDL
ncbi:MAG: hypothetical protein LV479_07765 [Methylacidiphilales bacterium]|nr:hypothetical protein [Candidatus Methylacidiphilales bacterium]